MGETPDLQPNAGAEVDLDPRPTFDEVVERYGRMIYGVALRLTGNLEDAADLSQDVFERVYLNLDRYVPGTFDGWLYRVTKNLFLDRVRRSGRMRTEPLPSEEWRIPASTEPTPADVVERRTLEASLQDGLASLSTDFRVAVVLCDVEGLSYEEISVSTGWPIGTVRSRIHRGRRALRDYLASVPVTQDAPRLVVSVEEVVEVEITEAPRRRSAAPGERDV